MELRGYQRQGVADIRAEWAGGARNVLWQCPPGGGKTAVFALMLAEEPGPCIAIAHRRELVSQMSVTLARYGVRHRIVAPTQVVGEIVGRHVAVTGRSWYDPGARVAVASVQTLVGRDLGEWAKLVRLWVTDECQHLVRDSIWDRALAQFPNARGLGVSGTSVRSDGKGLGRHADGVMDVLVLGPAWRDLIERGYLLDYRIFSPTSDLNLADVKVSTATGDFTQPGLREATRKSSVTGDIVESYLKFTPGKRGITFCVSVELAADTAARFREAGVPAEALSAATPGPVRAEAIRRFERGDILQLVNVDLFTEGFDCPAAEVVSMGRASMSFPWFAQAFGRPCRPSPGVDVATVIDHVGNVIPRHGVPDAPRVWTLDRRERRARSGPDDILPIRACPNCTRVYERYMLACPYCGHVPVPASRAAPEFVDGDLYELDADVLARLRGLAGKIDERPAYPYGATPEVRGRLDRLHRERGQSQRHLRDQMAWWGGLQRALGRDDREGYRRFYLSFGVDVATAQTLPAREAGVLAERINLALAAAGVVTGKEAA